MKRRVMLTVDVEAQPVRALASHVDRLIYGRFDGDSDFGIGRMFDIAERHDIRLTCFLDYAEQFLYGDALLEVGRYIESRNQDLQIHLHPEFIPKAVFDAASVRYGVDMFKVEQAQADLLIDIAVDAHARVTAMPPVAFRGGGYRYNDRVLNRLAERNLLFNSGYNPSRNNQPFNIGAKKQFLWTDGIIELPISCVWNFKNTGRNFDYNFNADVLIKGSVDKCVAKHEEFLQKYFDFQGDDAIAVMVMHSWSFLNISEAGHYNAPNQDHIEKFDALLRMLSEKYSVIAAGDLASMDVQALTDSVMSYGKNNETEIWEKMDEGESLYANPISDGPRIRVAETYSYAIRNCSICHGAQIEFEPDGNCKQCGSVARLRSLVPFVDLYVNKEVLELSRSDRPLLAFAMTIAEKKVLSQAFKNFKSVSLFGSYATNHEIGVDMRDLSRYESNSFSGVFGCLLFDYFVEHEIALQECFRVIAPSGLFFTHIAPYRIVDGEVHPYLKGTIKRRVGYFEYLPDNIELPDIKVGRDWFIDAMRRVGFQPVIVRVEDAMPGTVLEWFVGIKPGSIDLSSVMAFIDEKKSEKVSEKKAMNINELSCPVCGAGNGQFKDFNGLRRKCGACGSLERQRAFAALLKSDKWMLDLRNSKILLISPSVSEKKLFSELLGVEFSTLDVRPEVEPDIVADLCDMSNVPDGSFDVVYACHVLSHAHDLSAALSELSRILSDGGVLINYEPVSKGFTRELHDIGEISAHYGIGALEKYNIGRFRIFGDMDIEGVFSHFFQRKAYDCVDEITKVKMIWNVWEKGAGKSRAVSSGMASIGRVKAETVTSKISEIFHSIIPFGEKGRAVFKIELIQGSSSSLLFAEDHLISDVAGGFRRNREIVALNGDRDSVYVSHDLGVSWIKKHYSVRWNSKIRAVFSLGNGGLLVRTFSGRMYHFDAQDALVGSQDTGTWHWHGSQGIGESSTGTVMYGEYAALQTGHGVQQLSVWRYRSDQPVSGWKRVFTLPAAVRPPEGQLRHFHVCRPNPSNPKQWVLASGDVGAHNRLWLSVDDGDNWREVKLSESNTLNFLEKEFPRVLRFTQFSVLKNGDLIWGTDDTTGEKRAALIQLSAVFENPVFHFLGWLGKNCVRNISACGNDLFLMISESNHDASSADCILYDASLNRMVSLLLPNISQKKHTVTDSLGSAVLADGVGFYPALGAVLMDPDKRGIFRISINEVM